jgi:hypothetical protein
MPNGKHLIFMVISLLIIILVFSPSASYDLFVDALVNHPDKNPFCMTSKTKRNGVEYQLERCCYRDPPNIGVGQGVQIVETCEVCEFREGHQDEFQICEEEEPTVLRPGEKLGDSGPLTGGGVLDPNKDPSLKDDAMNPLSGGGVEDQGSPPPPPPSDQNVDPDKGVVEQGTKVPSSKGTKSPLDTILGFNGPPATSESDDSGLPTTGGNEVPDSETGSETSDGNSANKDTTNQNQFTAEPALVNSDNDSIPDEQDNCPKVANEDQQDSNDNGVGDVCDQEGQEQEKQQAAATSDPQEVADTPQDQDEEQEGQDDGSNEDTNAGEEPSN